MLVLFVVRRQWLRGLVTGRCSAAVVVGLFAWNVAITGEWNYQGGGSQDVLQRIRRESAGFRSRPSEHTFDDDRDRPRETNRVPSRC